MMSKCVLLSLALTIAFCGTASASKDKKTTKATAAPATTTPAPTAAKLKLELVKLNNSQGKDIVEVAVGSKDHSTLVVALKAAGLVETLTGPGPYTIFAPTNAAFDKLPKGTVETLLKPENKLKLKSILEHHAAAPAYNPSILSDLTDLDMVDGPKLKVAMKDGDVYVDDVKIEAALQTKNGIIYIVNTVLVGK
ncbi:MAG: fasciclin domain-containing protein [Bdellovibrionales bacterium]|nr:fasciclin domain-containing protein [Bdellovibrionales bacterium]